MDWDPFRLETLDGQGMGESQFYEMAQLHHEVFTRPGRTLEDVAARRRAVLLLESANLAPRCYLLYDGDRIVAKAETFFRDVITSEGLMTVMALSGVALQLDLRGRGLGAAIVRVAFERLDGGQARFCLFQTTEVIRPFYERLEACVVGNSVVNRSKEVPEAPAFWQSVLMRYPAVGCWPTGPINLQGPGW